jgi:hypothetical protein
MIVLAQTTLRSLLHDEKTYPDPMAFRPERFLNNDGTLNEDMQDPDVAAFGYGRRCVMAIVFKLIVVTLFAYQESVLDDISLQMELS